ncbi:hypothetical protein LTR27_006293 [Elasticomyces elasticus]|nr:hypothetical protein LTR27_006293 [Elasticomyces elasticus]
MDSVFAAKLTSISSAFIISGYMLAASQSSIPLLLPQPTSVSTAIFRGVYNRGAALAVPVSAISVAATAYLVYITPAESRNKVLYAVSGASTAAMIPLTRIIMMPGIKRLISISHMEAGMQGKPAISSEALGLLGTWSGQNWVRFGLSAAGGLLGLYAAIVQDV